MKAIFNLKKSIFYVAAFVTAVSVVSCDDDETEDKLTLNDLVGTYEGKMYVETLTAPTPEPETQAAEEGVTIASKLETTKATFENFPVADFIRAIEADEEVANKIIESLAEVKIPYELDYETKVDEVKDSIFLTIKPKVLEFEYTIPVVEGQAEEGEEPEPTKVVVTFKASEEVSAYSKKKVKMNVISEGIKVDDVALEDYTGQTILIDVNKK